MKFCLFMLAGWFLLAPIPAHGHISQRHADQPVIIIGGDQSYPPYEFLDKAGRPAGFNVELTQALAEVMGMRVEIRLGAWDDMRHALDSGAIDALEGISISEERSRILDCSMPHCIVRQSIFARRGSPAVSSLADLANKEVVVQRGGIMHDHLVASGIPVRLVLVDTHADALRLLASGKSDYAIVNTLTGLYFGLELGLSNVVPVGQSLLDIPYGYAVKKGNGKLLGDLNQGLEILKNTGRYQQIYDKWLGILESRPSPWLRVIKYGSFVLLPMLLIIAAVTIWSWSLKKRIARYIADSQVHQQELIQAGKMASLGILVSGVAHEINNPTGLILYNLPILRSAYQVAATELEERYAERGDFLIGGLSYAEFREELPRMFEEMQGGARRIKRIVDDLKDFARKDTSNLLETVDLNEIVQAAVRLLDNTIKKATRNFQVKYREDLPLFRGNSQRIEQVAVNLIVNACQALPDPEKGIQLSTFVDDAASIVGLAVQDEGIGIPVENLPRVTDPFFTTKREFGGTGLGLSVSAGIVKDHHGRLEFVSTLGLGSTVRVLLPIMKG